MFTFLIYLYGIIESINILSFNATLLSSVFCVLIVMYNTIEADKITPPIDPTKLIINPFKVFTVSLILTIFVPSKTTLAQMYVIPTIIESKAIQKDLPEIYEMAIEKLKKELK